MPINVVTAADLLRELIVRATSEEAKQHPLLTSSLGLRWLADGYREIVRRTKLLMSQYTGDLAASVSQTAPTDILDRLTPDNALSVLDTSGKACRPIERTWEDLRGDYRNFVFDPGVAGPVAWGWDERADEPAILLCPPPPTAVSGGLLLDYIKDPGPLARINDTNGTVRVTNGSAVVDNIVAATDASLPNSPIAARDAFGQKASLDELPTEWYRILSIDGSGSFFTLSEAWQGATSATSLCTIAQVSPVEYKRPGLVRYAAVEWALARWWETQEGGENAAVEAQALFEFQIKRIMNTIGNRSGIKLQSDSAYARHPGIRRF